jgi:hypothetical protein
VNTIEIAKGKTFVTKKDGTNKFVVVEVNGQAISYVQERNRMDYWFLGRTIIDDGMPFYTCTKEEFTEALKAWVPSSAERKAAKKARKQAARERYESYKDDYAEAVKMDILIDAARGIDSVVLIERMNTLLNDERKKTRKARSKVAEAFTEGFNKGKREGFDEGVKQPRNSLEGTGFADYWDS